MNYGITGPYADVNFGDYAMLPNNLAAFSAKPGVVFAYDREFVSTVLSDYGLSGNVDIVGVDIEEDVTAIQLGRAQTPLELLWYVKNEASIRSRVSQLDAVVVNGGGYINDLWAQPHRMRRLLAILTPAIIAAQLGKPIYFTANGFGPFAESADFFASILGRMHTARFTCRDALGSAGWLRRIGIPDDQIQFAPDDLLVIDSIIARRSATWTPNTTGDYIVVETYRPSQELARNMTALLALQDHLDVEVVLLPMNRGDGGESQAAVLTDLFPKSHVYPLTDRGYLPIEDALHAIAGARLTVTDRYHGLVSALGISAPVVSILRPVRGSLDYYYRKNAGVLQWRFAQETYLESDFMSLDWTDLPSTAEELGRLVARQREAYEASGTHFTRTREARARLVEGIFAP